MILKRRFIHSPPKFYLSPKARITKLSNGKKEKGTYCLLSCVVNEVSSMGINENLIYLERSAGYSLTIFSMPNMMWIMTGLGLVPPVGISYLIVAKRSLC